MNGERVSFEEIIKARRELQDLTVAHWLQDDLYKWTWWLNVVLTIAPWIIWWKLVDRKRVLEILAYGLLVTMTSTLMDEWGTQAVFWGYPDVMLPFIPRLFPIDYVLIPVIYMLVYQYFSEWKPFIIASVILAAVFAFALEKAMEGLGLYQLYTWKSIYSFPIYFALAVFWKWVVEKIMACQHGSEESY